MRIILFYSDPKELFRTKVDHSSVYVETSCNNGIRSVLYSCNTFCKRVQTATNSSGKRVVFVEYCSPDKEETFFDGIGRSDLYWLKIIGKYKGLITIRDLWMQSDIGHLVAALALDRKEDLKEMAEQNQYLSVTEESEYSYWGYDLLHYGGESGIYTAPPWVKPNPDRIRNFYFDQWTFKDNP